MGQPEGYAGNCIGLSMFRKQYTDIADRTINQACIVGSAARRGAAPFATQQSAKPTVIRLRSSAKDKYSWQQ
jgi:hypothetical protein